MNQTILKFGYPATLIREYEHWLVLLRPQQPSLGSLILAAKSDATEFGALDGPFFTELAQVVAHIEKALFSAVGYERLNYLMLMMVDPHVHFHVLPRYDGERSAAGVAVADKGWPKVPDLSAAVSLDDQSRPALLEWVKGFWPD
jgi:diadenosine tetraphosphate (Ap4A) HIT family hydrolase